MNNQDRGLPPGPELLEKLLEHRKWDVRSGQLDMVEIVTDYLEDQSSGVSVSAPVGTGKTLAYLLAALPSNRHILVCTSTKALQDQISSKELPELATDLKNLFDYDLTYSIVKGKNNYLCVERAEAVLEGRSIDDDEGLFAGMIDSIDQPEMDLLKSLIDRTTRAIETRNVAELDCGDLLGELSPLLRSQITATKGCSGCRSRWWQEWDEDEEGQKQFERCPTTLESLIDGSTCAYRTAYALALKSDVAVINSSLLAAEFMKSGSAWSMTPSLIRDTGVVIVDEAHHLANILTQSMSFQLDMKELRKTGETFLKRLAKRSQGDADSMVEKMDNLMAEAEDKVVTLIHDGVRRQRLRRGTAKTLSELASSAEQLIAVVEVMAMKHSSDSKDQKAVKNTASAFRDEVIEPIRNTAICIVVKSPGEDKGDDYTSDDEDTYDVTFTHPVEGADLTEEGAVDSLTIDMVPLDLSFFYRELSAMAQYMHSPYSRVSDVYLGLKPVPENQQSDFLINPLVGNVKFTMVLCSGTISEETGLVIGFQQDNHYSVESPFSVLRSRLYVPLDILAPNEGTDRWIRDAWKEAQQAILAAGGRTLFLTTSYDSLKTFSDLALENMPKQIRVLYQGNGMSRAELLAAMAQDEQSILIGTTSFWEGVDIPGPAITLVIMDKIMFPTQDEPTFEARRKYVERHGGNGFMRVNVDHASVMFTQGFGRLIRTSSDIGGVMCLDKRLITKESYGPKITRLVPAKVPITHDRSAFHEWLKFAVAHPDAKDSDLKSSIDRNVWSALRATRRSRRRNG